MNISLDSLKAANRIVLEGIADRERVIARRELALHEELVAIENERRNLEADKETIIKAETIQSRVFAVGQTPLPENEALPGPLDNDPGARQARARVGAKRYAMLATLRKFGSLTLSEIARGTGLNQSRVREQMRGDTPVFVMQIELDQDESSYVLTDVGADLLKRYEDYRNAQGLPLPSLTAGESAAEEQEVDPAHSKSAEAGVQGPQSATVKPVGEVVDGNMT